MTDWIAGTWDVDVVHSDVAFVVRHLGLTRYRRGFEKFSGEIVTGTDPLASTVSASVDITSFDTGLEAFNRHLFDSGFFDVESHPTAELRSTGLRVAGSAYELDAELTVRGITRPVTFALEHHGFGSGIRGETKTAFTAHAVLDRRDFGIAYEQKLLDGTLLVGTRVDLHLEIEAVLRS